MEHGGKQEIYHFGTERGSSSKGIYYAAHFSDVKHEVKPVSDGYRCVLIYNLCKIDLGSLPSSPCTFSSQITDLLANEWKLEPNALVFPLNHMYSDTGFLRENQLSGASSLKGFDALLASTLRLANEKFKGDDELSFYIGNAKKSTGIVSDFFTGPEMFEDDAGMEPIPYYSKPNSVDCKPKYLRERSLKYNNDFGRILMDDFLNFEGTPMAYPKCYKLNLDHCLVAHEFDSKRSWANGKTKRVENLENKGPGRKQIFYHMVIVVIKKSTELELLYQNGSLKHVTDFILEQQRSPQFKEFFVDKMKWLVKNWSEKESLVRAPEDTNEEFFFDTQCGFIWACIDSLFHNIARLKLFDLVEELVDKMIKSPRSCKVGYSEGQFFSCIARLPPEVERRVVLKMIAVQTPCPGEIACMMRKSDIDTWLNHIGLMAMRTSEKADFFRFCKAVGETMQADIAHISDSDAVIKMINKFKRSIPIIMLAFPCRLVTLKSVSATDFPWVHLIRELAASQVVGSISSLVDAALPGISINVDTQPEDVTEFIKLLRKTKPHFDTDGFAKEVVRRRSSSIDFVELIELLCEEGLGNIDDLFNSALPAFIDNVEKMSSYQIVKVLSVLKEVSSSSDISKLAVDVMERKAASNPKFLGTRDCIRFFKVIATEKIAEIDILVKTALPGIINNIDSMEYAEKVDLIKLLLEERMQPELKEFAVAVADEMDGKELGSILGACKNHLGDAYLNQKGLQPFIIARAMWLEGQLKNPLEFTWCMPEARYYGHPEIERFLRGPEETFYYHIYDSMKDIRPFVQAFNDRRGYQMFSAEATVDRQGSKPFVVITKNRGLYDEKIATRNKYSEELAIIRDDTSS